MLGRSSSSSASVCCTRSAGLASGGALPSRICSQRPRLTTGVSVSSNMCTAAGGHLRRVAGSAGRGRARDRRGRRSRRVAETRMSMSGCSRWNASIRGSSQSEPNEAKVVTLTRRRLRERRICCTLAVELGEPGLDRAQQRLAVGRDLHRARAADEQGGAELVFEALDLPADRRLREVQLVGGGAEAEQPGDRLEGPQVGQGEGAAGVDIHASAASIDARGFIGFTL